MNKKQLQIGTIITIVVLVILFFTQHIIEAMILGGIAVFVQRKLVKK